MCLYVHLHLRPNERHCAVSLIIFDGRPALAVVWLLIFLSSYFCFRHLMSEVSWPIITEFCHMFDYKMAHKFTPADANLIW